MEISAWLTTRRVSMNESMDTSTDKELILSLLKFDLVLNARQYGNYTIIIRIPLKLALLTSYGNIFLTIENVSNYLAKISSLE